MVRTGTQSISNPGSEPGAADGAEVRPSAVIVPQARPLTCGNVGYQTACSFAMCSVVV